MFPVLAQYDLLVFLGPKADLLRLAVGSCAVFSLASRQRHKAAERQAGFWHSSPDLRGFSF